MPPTQPVGSESLTLLGRRTGIPASPEDAFLETFPWGSDSLLCIRFSIPEFTSLCPITGAPDFAKLVIDYVADKKMLESKSLKLFLHSFRNHGSFHEKVIDEIGIRLCSAASPKWLRVAGIFLPRGGIPIDVFWQQGEVPKGIWVPDFDFSHYKGR